MSEESDNRRDMRRQSAIPTEGRSPSAIDSPNQQDQNEIANGIAHLNIGADAPIPSIEATNGHHYVPGRQYVDVTPRTPSLSPTSAGFRSPTPTSLPTPSSDRIRSTSPPSTTNISETLQNLNLNRDESRSSTGNSTEGQSPDDGVVSPSYETLAAGVADISLTPRNPSRIASPNSERLRSPSVQSGRPGISATNTPRKSYSYKVEDDLAPDSIFDSSTFQTALEKTQAIVAELIPILSIGGLEQDSEMRKHSTRAEALSVFESPVKRVVGLVGDSGVGKSRLISSLLDIPNFARSSGNGAACTCVITEFVYHNDNDFVLEVEYYTLEELKTQFTRLVLAYRQDPSAGNDSQFQEETSDLNKQIRLAHDTFVATFGPAILQQLIQPSESSAIDMIHNRLEMLSISKCSSERFTETTACSDRLSELTSAGLGDSDGHIWPLIRKISVKLKAHILSKGLVLVDLPGLRDMNVARVAATEDHLRHCHQIFSICDIRRAITDKGVKDVFALADKANLSNVAIVCTRSDEVNDNEAKKDLKNETANIQQMQDEIEQVIAEKADIEDRIRELKANSGEFTDDGYDTEESGVESSEQYQQIQLLQSQKSRLYDKERRKGHMLQQFLVKRRNEVIARQVHAKWPKQPKVFCVSNKIYDDHRRQRSREQISWVQLSGIPELRRYCLSIVDSAKVKAAKNYMLDGVPSLINSLHIWVESGAGTLDVERKLCLRAGVEEAKSKLDFVVGTSSCRLSNDLFNKSWQQIDFVASPQTQNWAKAARAAAEQWRKYAYNTLQAFCRRSGQWEKNGRDENWNEQATASMCKYMDPHWRRFSNDWLEEQNSFLSQCSTSFKSARSALSASTTSTSKLERALMHQERLLISAIGIILAEVTYDLEQLQVDALGATYNSFIVRRMQPTYDACAADGGKGVKARILARVEARFGSAKLFGEILGDVRTEFDTLIQKLRTELESSISEHLSVVMRDMDALLDENTITESESNPILREKLETALIVADAELAEVHGMIAAQ